MTIGNNPLSTWLCIDHGFYFQSWDFKARYWMNANFQENSNFPAHTEIPQRWFRACQGRFTRAWICSVQAQWLWAAQPPSNSKCPGSKERDISVLLFIWYQAVIDLWKKPGVRSTHFSMRCCRKCRRNALGLRHFGRALWVQWIIHVKHYFVLFPPTNLPSGLVHCA